MWHSLVARIVRDDEAAGSNPVIPTILDIQEAVGLAGACQWPLSCIYSMP